jgi:hypothetical protein
MIAYEFYIRGEEKEHLIGILPERRKDKERITEESILNWGRLLLGNDDKDKSSSLYFVRVDI